MKTRLEWAKLKSNFKMQTPVVRDVPMTPATASQTQAVMSTDTGVKDSVSTTCSVSQMSISRWDISYQSKCPSNIHRTDYRLKWKWPKILLWIKCGWRPGPRRARYMPRFYPWCMRQEGGFFLCWNGIALQRNKIYRALFETFDKENVGASFNILIARLWTLWSLVTRTRSMHFVMIIRTRLVNAHHANISTVLGIFQATTLILQLYQ